MANVVRVKRHLPPDGLSLWQASSEADNGVKLERAWHASRPVGRSHERCPF
ncbi:hypothetical protein NTGBS_990027 [Candidatus Nitrotoga sp. BS]|nr:hypothetical protein NTGBS_990027 [Candidatus Nitrotoga sp. BS]